MRARTATILVVIGGAVAVAAGAAAAIWVFESPSGDATTSPPRSTTSSPRDLRPAPPTDAGLDVAFEEPRGLGEGRVIDVAARGAVADDGRADDDAITAALADAAAGDTVRFPPGRFTVRRPGLRVAGGVTVVGAGADRTTIETRFDPSAPEARANLFVVERVDDVRIAELDIVADADSRMGIAVQVFASRRVVVERLRIRGASRFGIAVEAEAEHVAVRDNRISDASDLGGGGHGYGIVVTGGARRSWIDGNQLGPTLRHAVVVQFDANHNLIENNESTGTRGDAFDLHGEGEFANELRFNRAIDGGGSGIEVGKTGGVHGASGAGNYIHDNEVRGHDFGITVGFRSDGQYVSDNVLVGNRDAGIAASSVDDPDGSIDGLVLVGNRIDDTPVGFVLRFVRGLHLVGNEVRGGEPVIIGPQVSDIVASGNRFPGASPDALDVLAGRANDDGG